MREKEGFAAPKLAQKAEPLCESLGASESGLQEGGINMNVVNSRVRILRELLERMKKMSRKPVVSTALVQSQTNTGSLPEEATTEDSGGLFPCPETMKICQKAALEKELQVSRALKTVHDQPFR